MPAEVLRMAWIGKSLELIYRGGPVMAPLMLCSVTAVAVMLERFLALRRADVNTAALMEELKSKLTSGKAQEALELCNATPGPVAAVLAKGLNSRHLGHQGMERRMEEQALAEVPELERRLVWLDTIITVAPLLGLLGTVTGMIGAFHVIGRSGASQPTAITGGVAEALIATATGLTIAIVTLVGYNYLTDKVKALVGQMELRATQLANMLASLEERKEGELV